MNKISKSDNSLVIFLSASIDVLDLLGSLVFFSFHCICLKLLPKFIEFFNVLVNIVLIVYYKYVFLVMRSCLEGPVERSGDHKSVVHYYKFVMHLVLSSAVSSNRDSLVSHLWKIRSLAIDVLVIRNNFHVNFSTMSVNHSLVEIVISEVENTNPQILLSLTQISYQLSNVLNIREEKGINVPWFRMEQVIFSLDHQLFKALKDFLIGWISNLLLCYVKESLHHFLNSFFFVLLRYLC